MKKLLILLFVVLLLPPFLPASAEVYRDTYELEGFDSPEAAVIYFLNGLKNLDFEQMLDAYAWETRISRYSMDLQVWYDRTFSDWTPWFPGSDPFIRRINLESFREDEAKFIHTSLDRFLLYGEQNSTDPIKLQDEKAIREYMDRFDSGRLEALKELSNIRFLSPDDLFEGGFFTERRQDKMYREQLLNGADEIRYLPTVADMGTEKLFLAPSLARYGSRWYILTLGSQVMAQVVVKNNLPDVGFVCLSALPFSDLPARTPEGGINTPAVQGSVRYEGDGFDSPEDAVSAYLEGLRDLDPGRMLRAFAWETLAKHFDVAAYLDYAGFAIFGRDDVLPEISALTVRSNLHALRENQLGYIYLSVERYLVPDYVPPKYGSSVPRIKDDEELESLLRRFQGQPLAEFSKLEHIRFISLVDALNGQYSIEQIRDWSAKAHAVYGADEVRDIVAVADLGNAPLIVVPTVARYGEKWYIVDLDSATKMLIGQTGYATYAFAYYGRGFAFGEDFPLSGVQ